MSKSLQLKQGLKSLLLSLFFLLMAMPLQAFAPWENNFISNLGTNECRGLLAENITTNILRPENSAAIFTCVLMVCGHADYMNRNECSWFRDLAHMDDFGKDFQEIKNFLALMELEKVKAEAVKTVQMPPQQHKQIYAGVKAEMLYQQTKDIRLNNDAFYVSSNLLQRRSDASYVAPASSHLINFCSDLEASAEMCLSRGQPLPYDLMASSLLNYTTFDDDAILTAVKAYPLLATNLLPIPMLKPNEIYLDLSAAQSQQAPKYVMSRGGHQHLKSKFFHTMLISLIQESLRAMYTDRIPTNLGATPSVPDGITFLEAKLSRRGTLEQEIKRRLYDSQWTNELNALNKTGLLRELNSMMAVQAALAYELEVKLQRAQAMTAVELIFTHQQFLSPTISEDDNASGGDFIRQGYDQLFGE